ncbi:hypothetical protein K438DRAFT_1777509 [Mycena galopus ATCC 62051]|nr:hypothetical protein K438DRAFT_1777509 [Mycena galopus ATCC 62051]
MNLDSPQHPCSRNPAPSSRIRPDTTFSLKHMKIGADKVPASYPYALPFIQGLYRSESVYLPVPFFEFRGTGAPPTDLGTPGDVYIDLTPGARSLYCKCEEDWARWSAAATELLGHPHFVSFRKERYLNLHPKQGPEWVCLRTITRRQQALRAAGIFDASHGATAQAGWDLTSTLMDGYLEGRAVHVPPLSRNRPSRAAVAAVSSDSDSDSEVSYAESAHSKRARTIAPSSSLAANNPSSKSQAPPPYRHPSPDSETKHLEKELAMLRADKSLQRMRARKRELMESLGSPRGFRLTPEILQTLETDFGKYSSSFIAFALAPVINVDVDHSITLDEAKQKLPELRSDVDTGKKNLLAAQMHRTEVAKQLKERVQSCDAIRQKR